MMVVDDIVCCSECEGLFCKGCLQAWMTKSNDCPLCKEPFESGKISRKVMQMLNISEFQCPYMCGEVFKYEYRKEHFSKCIQIAQNSKECSFCKQKVSDMKGGLATHLRTACDSDILKCPDCDLNIYQMYFDRCALRQRKGHECKRDLKELVSLQRRFK